MIAGWILVLLYFSDGVTTVEYLTKTQCEVALKQVIEQHSGLHGFCLERPTIKGSLFEK